MTDNNLHRILTYPFGMMMLGRTWDSGSSHRYGFNGQENTNEVYSDGNAVDFGARAYNARLGKWFSIDPISNKYPGLSNYEYALGNPIFNIDIGGSEVYGWIEATFTTWGRLNAVAVLSTSEIFKSIAINQFEANSNLNPNEIDIRFVTGAIGPDKAGLTGIIVNTLDGQNIELSEFNGKAEDIKNFEIKVNVDLDIANSPEAQIVTLSHEAALHVLGQRALIDAYYESGDLETLKNEFLKKTSTEGVVQSHSDVANFQGTYKDLSLQVIGIMRNNASGWNRTYSYDHPSNFTKDDPNPRISEHSRIYDDNGNKYQIPNNAVNRVISFVNDDIREYGGSGENSLNYDLQKAE